MPVNRNKAVQVGEQLNTYSSKCVIPVTVEVQGGKGGKTRALIDHTTHVAMQEDSHEVAKLFADKDPTSQEWLEQLNLRNFIFKQVETGTFYQAEDGYIVVDNLGNWTRIIVKRFYLLSIADSVKNRRKSAQFINHELTSKQVGSRYDSHFGL